MGYDVKHGTSMKQALTWATASRKPTFSTWLIQILNYFTTHSKTFTQSFLYGFLIIPGLFLLIRALFYSCWMERQHFFLFFHFRQLLFSFSDGSFHTQIRSLIKTKIKELIILHCTLLHTYNCNCSIGMHFSIWNDCFCFFCVCACKDLHACPYTGFNVDDFSWL